MKFTYLRLKKSIHFVKICSAWTMWTPITLFTCRNHNWSENFPNFGDDKSSGVCFISLINFSPMWRQYSINFNSYDEYFHRIKFKWYVFQYSPLQLVHHSLIRNSLATTTISHFICDAVRSMEFYYQIQASEIALKPKEKAFGKRNAA